MDRNVCDGGEPHRHSFTLFAPYEAISSFLAPAELPGTRPRTIRSRDELPSPRPDVSAWIDPYPPLSPAIVSHVAKRIDALADEGTHWLARARLRQAQRAAGQQLSPRNKSVVVVDDDEAVDHASAEPGVPAAPDEPADDAAVQAGPGCEAVSLDKPDVLDATDRAEEPELLEALTSEVMDAPDEAVVGGSDDEDTSPDSEPESFDASALTVDADDDDFDFRAAVDLGQAVREATEDGENVERLQAALAQSESARRQLRKALHFAEENLKGKGKEFNYEPLKKAKESDEAASLKVARARSAELLRLLQSSEKRVEELETGQRHASTSHFADEIWFDVAADFVKGLHGEVASQISDGIDLAYDGYLSHPAHAEVSSLRAENRRLRNLLDAAENRLWADDKDTPATRVEVAEDLAPEPEEEQPDSVDVDPNGTDAENAEVDDAQAFPEPLPDCMEPDVTEEPGPAFTAEIIPDAEGADENPAQDDDEDDCDAAVGEDDDRDLGLMLDPSEKSEPAEIDGRGFDWSVFDVAGPDARHRLCRDLLRRLLAAADEQTMLTPEDLAALLQENACDSPGHNLTMRDVIDNEWLRVESDGFIRLAKRGDNWLLEHARPAEGWDTGTNAGLPPLRDWQSEALDAWVAHGRHGVVQAVTGTGKSRVGVEAALEALGHGHSVLILAPSRDLVRQWDEVLRGAGVTSIGRLGSAKRASFATHNVLIGTAQAASKKPPVRKGDHVLLIADEVHRFGSATWVNALHAGYDRRLGLTATFERSDDGLGALLDYFAGEPIYDIGFSRAIQDGIIAPYEVELIGVDLTASERDEYDELTTTLGKARKRLIDGGVPAAPFGSFMAMTAVIARMPDHDDHFAARKFMTSFAGRIRVLAEVAAKEDVVASLANEIAEANGTLMFTRRVEAAERFAVRLRNAGVPAQAVHGEMSDNDRRVALGRLKIGRIKAVVAPSIFDEGIDLPTVDLGIVLGGSSSRRQMIQRMGRVIRAKADGASARFLVVYARNTAEDVNARGGGNETNIDAITAAASRVTFRSPADAPQATFPILERVS